MDTVATPADLIIAEEIRLGVDICRTCRYIAPGGWCFPCELLRPE